MSIKLETGCYVDSARGVYAIDAILHFAEAHGFVLGTDGEPELAVMAGKGSISRYEFANEIEDDIDNFMNDTWGLDNACWGRNENGDWGLWEDEEAQP